MRHHLILLAIVFVGSCRKDEPMAVPITKPAVQITHDARPPASAPAAIVTTVAPDPAPAAPGATPMRLLYVTGLRGQFDNWGRPDHRLGGIGRQAHVAQNVRKQLGQKSVLQVVVGPTLVPPPGDLPHVDGDPALRDRRAAMIAQSLAASGVQALVPGASDLALGSARLFALGKKYRLPILLANVRDPHGQAIFSAPFLQPMAGAKLGIFGILIGASPPADPALTLSDPAQAARDAVTALRAHGATFIVAMASIEGDGSVRQLIHDVPGLDLVVRAHAGATTPRAEIVDKTLIVEAGRDGKQMGSLELHSLDGNISVGANTMVPLDRKAGSLTAVAVLADAFVRDTIKAADAGALALVDPRLANAQTPAPRGKAVAKPPLTENWTYGSSAACLLCHKEQAEQWQGTSHAHALASLERYKREHDPDCLTCHTTSFGRPGGTRSLTTATKYFPDVGCENCHGPSVAHVRANAKTGTSRTIPAQACTPCHPQGPGDTHFDRDRDLPLVMGKEHGARFAGSSTP